MAVRCQGAHTDGGVEDLSARIVKGVTTQPVTSAKGESHLPRANVNGYENHVFLLSKLVLSTERRDYRKVESSKQPFPAQGSAYALSSRFSTIRNE